MNTSISSRHLEFSKQNLQFNIPFKSHVHYQTLWELIITITDSHVPEGNCLCKRPKLCRTAGGGTRDFIVHILHLHRSEHASHFCLFFAHIILRSSSNGFTNYSIQGINIPHYFLFSNTCISYTFKTSTHYTTTSFHFCFRTCYKGDAKK